MTATLLLVRHAETEDNLVGKLSGWTDSDLSEHGERQIEVLAEHFNREHGHAAEIYTSPLTRARRTAEAIGALTGHTPVPTDDLREMYFGDLDGMPFEELKTAYGHLLRMDEDVEREDFVWPAGESRSGFTSRVKRAMDGIASAHPDRAVGVVTHGGVIAVFMTILQGESAAVWRRWVVPNASLTEVVWDPAAGSGRLVRHGDDAHLAALAAHEASPVP